MANMLKAQARYGTFVVHSAADLISRSLFDYGEWAQLEIEHLAKFIRPGDTVLDVGACLGTHSLAFSRFVGPSGKVASFEPNPRSFILLKQNAESNSSNVHPFQLALGRENGMLEFCAGDGGNFGAAHAASAGGAGTIQVPQQKLDDVWPEKVDFIKVDVEGLEYSFLQGAEKTIAASRPIMFMEVNALEPSYKLLEWARSAGYIVYGGVSAAFNPDNFNKSEKNIFGPSGECGILLIAEEKAGAYATLLKECRFPRIGTLDDLALLLLHKRQYPQEVFAGSEVEALLGIAPTLADFREPPPSRVRPLLRAAKRALKSFLHV